MSTINKSVLLSAIRDAALDALNLDVLNAVQIGASEYAIPVVPKVDNEGAPQRYAKVTITACNPTGTEKVPAFDLDTAVAKWEAEKAEKAEKAAEKAAKAEARKAADAERRAKREAEKAEKASK